MSVFSRPLPDLARWALIGAALGLGSASARDAAPASVSKAKPAQGGEALFTAAILTLKGCMDGEHLRSDCAAPAFVQLTQAAQAGHTGAQFELGARRFSMRFQREAVDAKSAADHAAYVHALTWLTRAAHAGHAKAQTYLPADVTQVLLTGKPTALADPFSAFPLPWLIEAANRARPKHRKRPMTTP